MALFNPKAIAESVLQFLPRSRREVFEQTLALGIGYLGAQLFLLIKMPLPWMMGAMTATAIAALLKAPVGNPRQLRTLVVPVLGVSLASAFAPQSMEALQAMGVGLAVLAVNIMVAAFICAKFYQRFAHVDKPTSLFAAMPGGLVEMVILSEGAKIDTAKVALLQTARVFTVVMLVPLWFRFHDGLVYTSGRVPLSIPAADVTWVQVVEIIVIAIVGVRAALLLRAPAAVLVGPLFLCGALQLFDVTNLRPVSEFVSISQLALGTSVGARLRLPPGRQALRLLIVGVIGACIMIALAVGSALLVTEIVSLPMQEVLLCFAPGGIAEMALMALALGVDVTVVVSVQVSRIAIIVVLARILMRFFAKDDEPPANA